MNRYKKPTKLRPSEGGKMHEPVGTPLTLEQLQQAQPWRGELDSPADIESCPVCHYQKCDGHEAPKPEARQPQVGDTVRWNDLDDIGKVIHVFGGLKEHVQIEWARGITSSYKIAEHSALIFSPSVETIINENESFGQFKNVFLDED